MKNTLGVVIVDGVGFRNFILSNFINESLDIFDQIIIFSGLPASAYIGIENSNIRIVELPVFRELGKTWFWRKMKEVAHMQKHKDNFAGISYNLEKNRPTTNSKRAYLTRLIFNLTTFFNSEGWINYSYKKQITSMKQLPEVKKYRELLENNKCNILFFTHQRPPYLAPLDDAAKALNIKTCSFIFSWDNLASKGRMAAPFDSFLVWSDLMKNELNYFYPATKSLAVEVVGTPQFEPYVLERYKLGVEEFNQRFEINPLKKTICYSCGDVSTSKNDGLYIEAIAEAVKIKEIEDVNFIVRTSPAEDGSRFDVIRKEYPFITWNFPKWELTRDGHPEPWSQRVPSPGDIEDLRMILNFCDLGINMCSTMSLDFMLFDKPVINTVFGNVENGLYNDQKYLSYSHYERVVKGGAVAVVKNRQELLKEINFSLQNPTARLAEQKNLIKLQVGKPLEGTSKRITLVLKKIATA
ncbi:hypothetical protein FK178_08440 [Antarcticibacterium arcticum]|uniref:UDP-glycosyltransferase n=1 Tax=Antarcticibacterium arcticum TaxID=2585771 RepID=A0A5B8YPE1_9FLAO|nr:hypothetical protein [Antarcticibacterium arcticum]QED37749.1 hypothetical protein FK178_08440 [Antarcticibacterium arcticum]